MPHTDNAMGALHPSKKAKGPHNIRPDGGKRPILQRTLEQTSILNDIQYAPLTVKRRLPKLDLKMIWGGVKLCFRVFQPPRPAACNDLERCAAAACRINVEGGNQRERLSAFALMLQIPAFKIGAQLLFAMEILHTDSPLWRGPRKLMRRSPFSIFWPKPQ